MYDRTANTVTKIGNEKISVVDTSNNYILFQADRIDKCDYLLLPANKPPLVNTIYSSPFIFAPASSIPVKQKTAVFFNIQTYTAPEIGRMLKLRMQVIIF